MLLTYSNINAGVLDCTHRQTDTITHVTWRAITTHWLHRQRHRMTFIGWLYCTLDRLQQSVTLTATMADVIWGLTNWPWDNIQDTTSPIAVRHVAEYSLCPIWHVTGYFKETLFQQWQRTEGGWASHPDKRHHNTKYEHEQINLSTATAWTQWHEAKSGRANLWAAQMTVQLEKATQESNSGNIPCCSWQNHNSGVDRWSLGVYQYRKLKCSSNFQFWRVKLSDTN